MLAVHFGAGNIGRGFIGQLLHQTGYDLCFVDVNETIINAINEKKTYDILIADEQSERITITNISGINSQKDPEAVSEAITKAEIITISAGANILPIIAKTIAKGLDLRSQSIQNPLNIFVCENMLGGGQLLKEHVLGHCTDELKAYVEQYVAFPSTAVDRIVPLQNNADPLMVMVEPFFEWVIDEGEVKGNPTKIEGAIYVNGLAPYIERKLFTVNTGHGAIAYVAYSKGIPTIKEAMQDNDIVEMVKKVLGETGDLLIAKHQFDADAHKKYIDKMIHRFSNPHISDDVSRVARQPIRKMGKAERFVKPALELIEQGKEPKHLAAIVAMILDYKEDNDAEAVELQAFKAEHGVTKTLEKYSGLVAGSPFGKMIEAAY